MMDDPLQFHIAPDHDLGQCEIARGHPSLKHPNKISWLIYEVNNTQVPYKLLNCAWHSKPCALRAVEVHPGKKCSSECKLGGESSIRYIHILNWKLSEVAHLQKWAPDVSHSDCIWRNCGEEFERNDSKDEYIPRWVRNTEPKVSSALKCALEDCQSKQGVKLFLWEVLSS